MSEPFETLLPKLLGTVRASAALAAQDVNFYKSLDGGLAAQIELIAGKILDATNILIQLTDDLADALESGAENLDDSWKTVANVLDNLFEKTDIAVDDNRRSRNKEAPVQERDSNMTYLEDVSASLDRPKSAKRMGKPQLQFRVPVDNSESHAFKPLLTEKPHATVSLEEVSVMVTPELEEDPCYFPHPYAAEIDAQPYPSSILEVSEPIKSQPWETTSAIWVDTVEARDAMLVELRKALEIAVDLEHHDYRTYYGLVCLMQISTSEQDWIVDTLALRDDLQVLNEVFADPGVVKVLHGAFMDIIWLQRDLGLYVVSLFDTYHACRLLGLPKHSLAYLLERFVQFKTSKKYQLADWRIRPLPQPMVAYARSDTHFLLEIFHLLRNQLVQTGKMAEVLYESRQVAKRRFEYTKYKPALATSLVATPLNDKSEPWRPLMNQYNLPFSKRPLVVALYEWRDAMARRDDESTRYVMPNQLLVSLVALAPIDATGVLSASNFITDHVRVNAKEVATLIEQTLQTIDAEDFEIMNTMAKMETVEETVDLDFVQKLDANFALLAQTLPETTHLVKNNSRLLTQAMTHDAVWSVEYGAEKTTTNISVTAERIALIQETLAAMNDQEVVVHEPPVFETDEAVTVVEEEEYVPILKEQRLDPNEVITLRKKQTANHRNSKQLAQSEGDAFDYKSADKVLLNPVRERPQKGKKRNTAFDPYSQESEGPKPAKRANTFNSGKTSSFVQKRKR
ncbi:hypothetical protein BABINDRAFT_14926 [Babjeviella inositovora NRRL Y-12698]|uniref:HRDC domain-containing protein n=1 Tax=Babjeviella inositovora NRRL Y-12698 TaxID=984486 RepID=A0A1E3QLT4_9ASCO|nr:uncharacterized protein BABINDRAFT_14926 [Babjeviella inositovora NRRL Y-12698]ODQ77937.1 hypothetical protein BABINDRAFT_14926 [Babjeviella inositovora NRRL Y-12698]